MSQIMTSTARQENPISGDEPLEIERHAFQQAARHSARASTASSSLSPPPELPDLEEAAHQRALSMVKNRVASEENGSANANATMRDFPLRISTTEQPRPMLNDETQVCVCTPAAARMKVKVPRPRNSFILYRSHMQVQTLKENPGVPNPQLSKIIGERWANESQDVKEKFQKMAAEEAERHKLEYPDYAFKPQRKGVPPNPATASQSYVLNGERCSTCNGFQLVPLSSLRESFSGKASTGSPSVARFESSKRRHSQVQNGAREVPERRRSSSPNPKRRRLPDTAGSQGVAPIQVRQTADKSRGHGRNGCLPASAGHDGRYVHVDTPRNIQHDMAPPPPPPRAHPGSAHPTSNLSGYQSVEREPLMRLPPLETAIAPSQYPAKYHSAAHEGPHGLGITPSTAVSANRMHETRSPIEQIKSLTFSRKQASFNKICPRLPLSVTQPRGAIIAVEGLDQRALQQVSVAVERTLICCRETVVTSWSHKTFPDRMPVPAEGDDFVKYAQYVFADILSWHAISREITHYVNKRWVQKSPSDDASARQSPAQEGGRPASQDDGPKIPVALIKNGYSMTHSERIACATSTNLQNYAPIDHWQWMATQWRGMVGQDLMVYVKSCDDEDMQKLKTVEYSSSLRVLIVRVPAGQGMNEATERRLNFEMIEWITDVWAKEVAGSD